MNEIQIFSNPEFGDVRTLEINGEAWFVGKDVVMILGYSNASKAVTNHVDDEDKQFVMMNIADSQNGNVPIGQTKTAIINESGLYSLILSSKLPSAKAFKRWVTAEILPSIRKHGAFMTENTIKQVLSSPDFIIRLATELKNEQTKRANLEAQVKMNEEKVVFANALQVSKSTILVGELTKILKQNSVSDTGQNKLFRYLRENGYLIKEHRSDHNMPTQKSMQLGLFEIQERPIKHNDGGTSISKTVRATAKGQKYFINLFLGGR